MPLNIRDPRAAELAKELALRRNSTMTAVIVEALEAELRRERQKAPLRERLAKLAEETLAMAGPNAHEVTKEDIDAMWGQ